MNFVRRRISPWLLALIIGCGAIRATAATDPFLMAAGPELRTAHGLGTPVVLRGVNLGGWLLFEPWMTPMDSSGLKDDWSARELLTRRFGTATCDRLIAAYEDAWIDEADFDHIAALGVNVVRLPFWYRNLQDENGIWRADAFQRLDWCVAQAAKRGIYTILDLHGVPGGQTDGDSTGRIRKPKETGVDFDFWKNAEDQRRSIEIWTRVAAHFQGNPWVAAYDLLNEPSGAPTRDSLWAMYDRFYKAIRAVDSDHVISVEGCWGGQVNGKYLGWGLATLPPPEQFGWKNVLYQTHSYEWDWNNLGKQKAAVDRQVREWEEHRRWGVPVYVGEFNCFAPEPGWAYAAAQFAAHGMSWTVWSYKAIHGSGSDSWGVYNFRPPLLPKPNLQTDSAETIRDKWSRWSTAAAFALNPMLQRTLFSPPTHP